MSGHSEYNPLAERVIGLLISCSHRDLIWLDISDRLAGAISDQVMENLSYIMGRKCNLLSAFNLCSNLPQDLASLPLSIVSSLLHLAP